MTSKKIGKAFGEHLKKTRQKAGLTQEALAFRTRLHRTYISLLERGLKSPTLETLFRICSALNVPPEDFVAEVTKLIGPTRQSKA